MSAEKQTAYVVTCPRCDTRNAYRTSAAGTEVRCEMCHTRFTAPKLVETRKPSSAAGGAKNFSYAVSGEEAADSKQPSRPHEFAVVCERCDTRMTFREEHVGRKARCPDCYTELIVPKAPPLQQKPQITQESYGVAKEEQTERPNPREIDAGYAFIPRPSAAGPLFSDDEIEQYKQDRKQQASARQQQQQPQEKRRRRELQGASQTSSTAKLDRGASFETWSAPLPSSGVTGPPQGERWKHEVAPTASTGADAHTHKTTPKPKQPAKKKISRAEKNAQRVAERRSQTDEGAALRSNPIPDPPALPMISGVYSTPFRVEVLYRWVVLTFGLLLDAVALGYTWYIVGLIGIYGMIVMFGAVLITSIIGGYAVGCIRAIVLDTANGAVEITDWPEWDWREWVYAFGQFIIPAMLALGIAHYPAARLEEMGLPYREIAFALAALVFPVLYLSSIVENNWLHMISPFVLRSYLRIPHVWVAYYLQVLILLAVGFGILAIGMELQPIVTGIFICPLAAAFMFIWGRLSGRLLWMAGQAELAAREEA